MSEDAPRPGDHTRSTGTAGEGGEDGAAGAAGLARATGATVLAGAAGAAGLTTAGPNVAFYGPDPEQRVEVWRPARADPAAAAQDRAEPAAPAPVAILVHGGYWRSRWALDLMDPLAADLAARGWAVVNVEYRRPDRHPWAATVGDVRAALAAVPAVAEGIGADTGRTAVLGHSAGGQLAVQAAGDAARRPIAGLGIRAVAALAGVLDLEAAWRLRLSDGAVAMALGAPFDPANPVHTAASAMHRPPGGPPAVIACGTGDDPHLVRMSRAFARRCAAQGRPYEHIEAAGDHFDIIDPAHPLCARAVDAAQALV